MNIRHLSMKKILLINSEFGNFFSAVIKKRAGKTKPKQVTEMAAKKSKTVLTSGITIANIASNANKINVDM